MSLEAMLIKNLGLPNSYIEGALVSNSLVVRDSHGWVTHRIEMAANGVDIIVRNATTGLVEHRINL